MTETSGDDRVVLELTTREAMIVASALRRYEPYWSAAEPEQSRVDLLAEIRGAIDGVIAKLQHT